MAITVFPWWSHIQAAKKQGAPVSCSSVWWEMISQNHDSIYASHPGRKRTLDVICIRYWWPRMRQDVDKHVRECDECQRRKQGHEYRAPLGEVREPTYPFETTSMDICGPCPLTPRKNKYLLTFICNFTKYAEAIPIPDMTAEVCARGYATQIIARHGTGSILVTDHGRSFVGIFQGNLQNFGSEAFKLFDISSPE